MKIIKDNVFTHSIKMVKKTFKNYLMLSVTVVLSFSIMLGYLVFTDSNIYNDYKEILGADEKIVIGLAGLIDDGTLNMLISQLDSMEDTNYYIMRSPDEAYYNGNMCSISFLPSYIWGNFENTGSFVFHRTKINGQWEYSLNDDEALVTTPVYEGLKKTYGDDMYISIQYREKTGEKVSRTYKVVGCFDEGANIVADPQSGVITNELVKVYVTAGSVSGLDLTMWNYKIVVHTPKPDAVTELLDRLEIGSSNMSESQNYAITEKKIVTENKYVIAMVLFILLGINLYSSFANTLNDRKFEIGVKRAIGASKLSIMLQFIIEGLMVMFANIIASIVIIVNLSLVYKYYQLHKYQNEFVITIADESLVLYVLFSFFLTFIFSMIFAYKSTQVEIIKYLKEE